MDLNKFMGFGYIGLLKAMLYYKELRNHHALLTADLLYCTESKSDVLKGTDHFAKNVFGFDSFKKTVRNRKKYPVSKKKKRSFIGMVTLHVSELCHVHILRRLTEIAFEREVAFSGGYIL